MSRRPQVPSEQPAPARAYTSSQPAWPILIAAWCVPGGGHVLHGDMRRGAILFVTLILMFALGIAFGGRLFPFQVSEWLVFLAAIAQWGIGIPRVIAGLAGVGDGDVIAVTYEYGNTFLMTSGLLNMLAMLDAFDRARGLKGPGLR